MDLKVDIQPLHPDGSQRVRIGGRLDTHSYGWLDDRLALVLASPVKALILDLGHLEYVSSAGVRSVFRTRRLLASRGGKLVLANVQPQVQKVFDIVKAVPLSEIFKSVADADAYLDTIQRKILRGSDED